MPPIVLQLLQGAGLTVFILAVLYFSKKLGVLKRVRGALVIATVLLAILLVSRLVHFPGQERVFTFDLGILVLIGVYIVLQVLDELIWEHVLKPKHISVPRLLFDVFNFVVLVGVGLALLKTLFDVNLTGFLVTSTVLSAILGLSLQDLLTSLMAGIALQIESPFQVRDWIRVGDKEGEVTQMNWRSITLRSRDNNNVIIPNSIIAKQDISNFSRPQKLQLVHVTVGVSYATPPGLVKGVISRAIADADGVAPTPAVQVFVKRFAESAVEYDLRFWIEDFERLNAISDSVQTRVWYALDRAGMAIPFPQRDVHMRTISEEREEREKARGREDVFRVLRQVTTFQSLSDSQIQILTGTARFERYATGEILVRQGEEGRSLFVIRSGTVSVERAGEAGSSQRMATLRAGDFFGEMSLLTGEPRSATVVSMSEVEVVVVDKSGVAAVLSQDQKLVKSLSDTLERRSRQLARTALEQQRLADVAAAEQVPLFLRIQRFFGIEN